MNKNEPKIRLNLALPKTIYKMMIQAQKQLGLPTKTMCVIEAIKILAEKCKEKY